MEAVCVVSIIYTSMGKFDLRLLDKRATNKSIVQEENMSDLYKIILTSSLTVCGGVIALVAGQVLIKFLIEPFQNYTKLVSEIADSLVLFANVGPGLQEHYLSRLEELDSEKIKNPQKELTQQRLKEIIIENFKRIDEAKQTFRQQASKLMGATNLIPLYNFWAVFGFVPKRKNIIVASSNLIGLSNSTSKDGFDDRRLTEIAKCLRIKVLSERYGK